MPDPSRLVYWLWLALLLVHLPALIRDWMGIFSRGTFGGLSMGFVLLNASIVVFVLKMRSVRWLEFGRDPRSILSFCVAIALLHINVGQDDGQTARALEGTQALAGMFFAVSLARVQRFLDRLGAPAKAPRPRPVLVHGTTEYTSRLAGSFLCKSNVPRAPPLPVQTGC